jgi:hypothetical protein
MYSHMRAIAARWILGALGAAVWMGATGVTNLQQPGANGADPYLWLEEVHGQKSLAWVKAQNARSIPLLQADPDYRKDYDAILKVMDATDRIPYGDLDHQYVFNFWQDAEHSKGIWRRTSVSDYGNASPAWDIVLDLDKLAAEELSAAALARRRRRRRGARVRPPRQDVRDGRLQPCGSEIFDHLPWR